MLNLAILPDKESDYKLALNVGNERDVPKLVSSSDKVDLSKEPMGNISMSRSMTLRCGA